MAETEPTEQPKLPPEQMPPADSPGRKDQVADQGGEGARHEGAEELTKQDD